MAPIHDAAVKCDVEGLRRCLPPVAPGDPEMRVDERQGDPADHDFSQGIGLYFQKVVDAGGFKKYEQAHLAALTATFASKLRLPARPARLVAEYWGHVGYY
jgi:hypothetical protein